MRYFKIVVFAVLLFILVVFAHYNQEGTSLIFFSYGDVTYQSYELPLFAFFYIVILITIVVMSLLEVVERTSLRAKNKKLKKENAKLQEELTAYKEREASPTPEPSVAAELPEPEDQKEEKKESKAAKKKKKADTEEEPAQ